MNRDFGAHRYTSRGSGVARDRVEILDLIRTLVADRAARGARARRASAPPSRPPGARTTFAPERFASAPRDIVLESLDRRLRSVEEALRAKSERASVPPSLESRAVFGGMIRGQMLSDMLQLVSSNSMTGEFVVQSGASTCVLYFDEGRICHAEGPGLKGEQAFFAAFAFETGRYHFIETAEPPATRTIEAGTQFLILEALRQIDEGRPDGLDG
jgi:hypothetical protein